VDFVAVSDEGVEYYQVAYTVIDADGKTLGRELAPLDAIKDHNLKYLLTMDYTPLTSHNGIKQINALDWLLK
jgi:predicted AAA+ superfamily ATPase